MEKTALYRCDKCGDVIRAGPGETHLGHIHEDAEGKYLGKEAEGRYVEFEDDGREAPDIRDSIWIA